MTFKALLYYLPFLEEINTVIPYNKNLEDAPSTIVITTSNLEIANGNINITFDLGNNYIKYLFGNYNCIRINTDDNTLGDFQIVSSSQIGGTRVRFYCTATQYQIARLGNILNTSTANGSFPYLAYAKFNTNPYIEYGYAYDSILNNQGALQWNKEGTTDLYRPPVKIPDTNIFEGRTRIEWNYLGDLSGGEEQKAYKENFIKSVKYWINVYVRQGAKINDETVGYSYYLDTKGFYDDIKDDTTIYKNKIEYHSVSPALPYTIFTFGVSDTRYRIEGEDDSDETATTISRYVCYDSIQQPLSSMIEAIGSANILQITASPIPPFNDVFCEFKDKETIKANDKRLYMKSVKVGIYDDNGYPVYMYALKCNYINANPYKSLALTYRDFVNASGNTAYNILNPFEKFSTDKLNTYENPYVSCYTNKIILTSPNGAKYTINPVELGAFNFLYFNLVYTFELGNSTYITGIDFQNSSLPVFLQNTTSSAKVNLYKIGNGLVGSTTNAFTYAVDKLDEFILNNQNYYATRDATLALQREQADYKMWLSGGSSILSGGIATIGGAASGNLGLTIGGLISMGMGGMKAISDNIMTNDSIDLSLANSNRMLEDLSNAPDKLITGSSPITDLILDNNAIYLNFYTACATDKQTLQDDFLCRGIYLNKTVLPTSINKYLTVNLSKYDKQYCKFFKGNVSIGFGLSSTNPAQWNMSSESVKILIKKLSEGAYLRKIESIYQDNYYGYDYENYIKMKQPINSFKST